MKREERRQKREVRMSVRTILMAMVMTVALLGPAVSPKAEAQIILQDEEFDINGRRGMTGDELPTLPLLGLTTDQYAPLDGGILLLSCLGGAYLLRKRKKK
jgi:hypothetical protein